MYICKVINNEKLNNMKTIAELNQIMCDAVGVSIESYNSMDISGQNKVREKYMKQVHNLKTRKQ
jgi:hypothetical protein